MSKLEEGAKTLYPYRCVILIIASAIHAALQFAILIVPGVAPALIGQYGIPATAFSLIATMPYLTGFLFGVASGAAADKTSIRLVLIAGLAVAFVGAALRAFSTAFAPLLVSSFFLGFALAALNANSAKIMRLWFPGKSTSVAMGIYIAAATVGAALGLGVGPVLPSVEIAFQIPAVLMGLAFAVWVLFGRKHPDGESAEQSAKEPIVEHLKVIAKSKNVWLISLCLFALFGCTVSVQTFANIAFTSLSGSMTTAGIIAAINTIAIGAGGIIMPIIVSRMKRLKPIFICCGILNAVVLFSILHIGYGPLTFVILGFEGLLYGVLIPMGKTLPALIPDVKLSHVGVTGGMQSMMQNLGAFLIPSFVVTPVCTALAGGNEVLLPLYVFSGAAICSIACAVFMFFVPETGTSAEARLKKEAAQVAKV
ncbi:MAG: MFS transporter [Coriobacteriales bacterium]|nr:MFS transporter [Coriobacteriales bacterium]